MTEPDDELEVEYEEGEPATFPDILSGPSGEVFFYPDLGTFCQEHSAKAVQIDEAGGVWLYPAAGGKPVNLSDWKPSGQVKSLRSVQ